MRTRSLDNREPLSAPRCGICFDFLGDSEILQKCSVCGKIYHSSCYRENKGCASFGCTNAPDPVRAASSSSNIDLAEEEKKSCPKCGEQIRAEAVRCRKCGAILLEDQPGVFEKFADKGLSATQRGQKMLLGLISILCIFPLTMPVFILPSLLFYLIRRKALRAYPQTALGIARIALISGSIQLVLLASVFGLYVLRYGIIF